MIIHQNSNVLFKDDRYESHQDLEIAQSADLVTSSCIYDATFSGYNSIVLGTFGKSVLFFTPFPKQMTFNYDVYCSVDSAVTRHHQQPTFDYEMRRDIYLKHSILGLTTSSLSNNGSKDLIILTLNGVSVWQYEPNKIIDIVNKKIEANNLCI